MDTQVRQQIGDETAPVLEELVRESLHVLLPVTGLVTWAFALVLLYGFPAHTLLAYAALGLVGVTLCMAYGLHRRRLSLAVGVYLAGLMAVVTVAAFSFRSLGALYLYMVVLPLAATLTSPRVTWGLALVCAVLAVAVAATTPELAWPRVATPVAATLLTALALWLSSRRLFTALAWALNMTRQAQKSASLAQQHRAEVRRVLKSLDEAYVRLERANEALIYAREAAEQAYRFKADFAANVSHELRTPLNLIVGFSEMVATAPESYGGVLLPSPYRGDVTAIYRSARHLSDLIDDVLDLSRIEAGSMPLLKESADLGEVVREAADMVRGLAEARGLRLELAMDDCLPPIRLDRTRIRQVLLNLLTNATRFTDRGSIRVHVQDDGADVVVTVQDSGRGIAAERLVRAFEAFTQLEKNGSHDGSGLGLAVSKRFIELHGGRMWIESEPGRGTLVSFALPKPAMGAQVPALTRPAGSWPKSEAEAPLVLVVQDDPHALSILRRYVDGCRFALADSMAEARTQVQELLPAAVLVDPAWMGPGDATRAGLGLPPETPLIACPLPSMRRLGVLLGADDYLAKPVTRDDLARALARLPEPPRKALIVDDDADVVRLLARLLRACAPSLQILEAFGGRVALEIAHKQQPDLILTDLYMPELDGYQVLEEAKRDPALAKTQIIIVSVRPAEQESASMAGEMSFARAAGFSLTEVLQVLQATLPVVTRRSSVVPASGGARPADRPDGPAW